MYSFGLGEAVGNARGAHAAPVVAREQLHELAKGLRASEAAEHRGLVEAGRREVARVQLAVADGLVVRDVEPLGPRLLDRPDEREWDAQHRGVAPELLAHAERRDDQPAAAASLHQGEPESLELHHALAEAERGEDRPPPAEYCPAHHRALVRLQQRMDLIVGDLEPQLGAWRGLAAEELRVARRAHRHHQTRQNPAAGRVGTWKGRPAR
jgi:hypothetical protein